MTTDREALVKRITGYLSTGGLFNPELAIHDRVRDLLIDCREALTAQGGGGWVRPSAEMVSVPRKIDRSRHRKVLDVWNDCMMHAESLEMTWPKIVNAMLTIEKEEA